MLFENVDYMADKINGNIIEVEGAGLCYTRGGAVKFYEKVLDQNTRDALENQEINPYRWLVGRQLKAPQLGYVQYGKDAVYVSRRPARIWKVGLSKGNCMNELMHVFPAEKLARCLVDLKRHNYPNWQQAQRMLEERVCNSVALSKRYAVYPRGVLKWMEKDIGKLVGGEFQFDTHDEMDFHRNNIASLGIDLPMKVVPRKKIRKINPEVEDV